MNTQFRRCAFLIMATWVFSINAQAVASTYEVPKLKAFLPMSYSVPPTEAMPLDGVYMIAGMEKRIRIERGRSFAVDSWMVMMVLEVRPNMVIAKNIMPTAPGKYTGYNLTFKKEEIFEVTAAGNVETKVGGAHFTLYPIRLDNQAWFDQEMIAAGFKPIPAAPVQREKGDYRPTAPPKP